VKAARASAEFFGVLGVSPALGRVFTVEEDRQVAHVTVVSHAFWMSHMSGDPGVLGTSLDFDGEPYVVIGVLPEDFRFQLETDAWIPLGLYPGTRAGRGAHSLGVVARLKEGTSVSRAQAELESIAKRLAREYPDTNARCGVFLEPLQASLVHDTRAVVLILMAAVAFVLLIACANIGGLLVTRSTARAREFAVRIALGASRARLARQLVVESLAVAALGGALGAGLAALGVAALRRIEIVAVPRLDEIAMDLRVLAATVGITVLTGLLFGMVPALHISRQAGGTLTTRGASSGRDERRVQSVLTVWQVGFALVLLVGAGLMVRTLMRLHDVDPGFQARGILAVDLTLSDARYPKSEDAARFYRSVVEAVAALPGAQRAALVSDPPLSGGAGHYSIGFHIAGAPAKRPGDEDFAYLRWVSPEYFNAIGVPLLSGRLFTEADAIGEPPVAIINAAMAARHFPGNDPIGRELLIRSGDNEPSRIVGVVGDLHQTTLTDAPEPQMYTPFYQAPAGWGTLLIKTAGDPRMFASAVLRAVRGVDPQQPIFNVRTLENAVEASIAPQRLTMRVLAAFALSALGLVALGIYGVVAFQVSRRTREIAVRVALGARPADVLWIVARQGLAPVALGMLLGIGGAVALTRSLRGLLFEVEPLDPLSFAAAASLLLAVTLLACLLPARRALRTEPAIALTNE
jgi:putative ABC transport system permease protein